MKPTLRKITLIILSLLLCAVFFVACDRDEDNLSPGQPVPWEVYLDTVAGAVAKSIIIDGGAINLSARAGLSNTQGDYEFSFDLNYDLNDIDNSILIFEVKTGQSAIVSVKADNESAYVDVAPNVMVADAKLKLVNVNIFDLLHVFYSDDTDVVASAVFKQFLVNTGKLFFDEVDVSEDNTVYEFTIKDDVRSSIADYAASLKLIFGSELFDKLVFLFGESAFEDLLGRIPELSGKISFSVINGRMASIDTSKLLVDGSPVELGGSFVVGNTLDAALYEKYPQSDDGYKETKIGNSSMKGSLSIMDDEGGKRAAKYSYELNANIDMLALMLSGYDLSKLSEDNFLHFRLEHRCGEHCTEFCRDKLGESGGAIVDIAFSPRHFGSANLYVNLNMRYLMSRELFGRVNSFPNDITVSMVPDYCLLTVPGEEFGDESPLYFLLTRLFTNNLFAAEGFSMRADEMTAMFSEVDFASELLGAFFKSEEFSVDELRFNIDKNHYGQAEDYDIYKATVFIIADDVAQTKRYDNITQTHSDSIALSWSAAPPAESANGELLTNIYDKSGNLLHGVGADGAAVPMSREEAECLEGRYIDTEYIDIMKERIPGGRSRIVGVENLDPHSTAVQNVTLRVEYPNAFDYLYLSKLFGELAPEFSYSVEARIKLTGLAGCELEQDTEGKTFRVTYRERTRPAFLTAEAVYRYVDGTEKRIPLEGETDSVVKSIGLGVGNQYSVIDWGEITVTFDTPGGVVKRTFNVQAPDRVNFVVYQSSVPSNVYVGTPQALAGMLNAVKMYAVYGNDSVQIVLGADDFVINDIPLSQSSSDWDSIPSLTGINLLTFHKSNDYVGYVSKLGNKGGRFVLNVKPEYSRPPEYSFTADNFAPDVYYAGQTYSFSGKLQNSLHGESGGDNDYLFTAQVYKGAVDASGRLVYEYDPAASGVSLELELGDASTGVLESSSISLSYNLPDLLLSPLELGISAKFAEAGHYKVVLLRNAGTFDKQLYEWNIFISAPAA